MEIIQPPHSKVPGETKVPQKEFILNKDLTKLSIRELMDLKSRQLKLLEKKSWLKKLPDKGEKIQKLYDRVIEALKRKDEIESAVNLLKDLNLETKDIENMEWEGRNPIKKQPLDSDDDEETDPVAILVSSNSLQKKIVKHEKPPKPLITEQDLKEAEEITKDHHLKLDQVLERCCKIENINSDQRFLPYKSVKSSDHPHKLRDNTAASPPFLKQGTKMLTIRESIEIENESRKNMKVVSEKHAVERLAAKNKELKLAGFKITPTNASAMPSNSLSMSKYRLPAIETEEAENSDDSSDSSLSDEECGSENV